MSRLTAASSRLLTALDLALAVATAIGGLAIVLGLDTFPREWLAGSPFSDYVLPGLILGVVVGGASVAASIAMLRHSRFGPPLSVAGGALMAGWICGELVMLNQNGATTSPRSPVEASFLLLGLATAALGLFVWLRPRKS